MPSPLATLLFTWAAVYTYVGAFYCVLHLRRPTHREYLAFGLGCLGLAAFALGSALGADAKTLREGTFALRLSYVGGFATVAFFADFALHSAGRRSPRMLITVYAVSALGIVADVLGLLVDPDKQAAAIALGIKLEPRLEPVLTPVGAALVGVATGFAGWAVWVSARAARSARELRWFVLAGAGVVLAGVFDTASRIAQVRTFYLLEHAGLLPVLAISWILLRRFVRTADELGRRTEELRRSYSNLRVTQEELVRNEQLAAVGELSAVIAHEVRNPLAIIKNAVSSLRRPTLRPADRGVLLGILDEEVDRLNRLVRDLLAYARPVEPRGQPVHLGRLVEEVVEAAVTRHEDPSSIEVKLDFERCPALQGDPELLRQAIANVVDNALWAMPTGGTLQVLGAPATSRGKRAVRLEVIDDGEGMDSLVLAKARDPFFTTRAAGTGLGLAIAVRVIKNHGGTLEIESEAGVGTTVQMLLPVDRPSSVPPPPEDP